MENKFYNNIFIGDELYSEIYTILKCSQNGRFLPESFLKRNYVENLSNWIINSSNDNSEKDYPFILYGFHRSGKTVSAIQIAQNINRMEPNTVAFINLGKESNIYFLGNDAAILKKSGIKYLFIDEIELISNFAQNFTPCETLFTDDLNDFIDTREFIFNFKVIFTGTHSLALVNFGRNENALNNNCHLVNTSYIGITEWVTLKNEPVLNFVKSGGTLQNGYFDEVGSSQKYLLEMIRTDFEVNNQEDLLKEKWIYQKFPVLINSIKTESFNKLFFVMLSNINNNGLKDVLDKLKIDKNKLPSIPEIESINTLFLNMCNKNPKNVEFRDEIRKYYYDLLENMNEIISKNIITNVPVSNFEKELIELGFFTTTTCCTLNLKENILTANSCDYNSKFVCIQPGIRYQQSLAIINFTFNNVSIKISDKLKKVFLNASKHFFEESVVGEILETSVYLELREIIEEVNDMFRKELNYKYYDKFNSCNRFGITKVEFKSIEEKRFLGEYDIILYDSIFKSFSILEVKSKKGNDDNYTKNLRNIYFRNLIKENYKFILKSMQNEMKDNFTFFKENAQKTIYSFNIYSNKRFEDYSIVSTFVLHNDVDSCYTCKKKDEFTSGDPSNLIQYLNIRSFFQKKLSNKRKGLSNIFYENIGFVQHSFMDDYTLLNNIQNSLIFLNIKGNFINNKNDLLELHKQYKDYKEFMPGFPVELPENIYNDIENHKRSFMSIQNNIYSKFYIFDSKFLIAKRSMNMMSFNKIVINGFLVDFDKFVSFFSYRFVEEFKFSKDICENLICIFSEALCADTVNVGLRMLPSLRRKFTFKIQVEYSDQNNNQNLEQSKEQWDKQNNEQSNMQNSLIKNQEPNI